MPNKSATDKIGEAAGVNFIDAACAVTTETRDDPVCGKKGVFVAQAQGQVRMPDGSWRKSTVEAYEFDPVLRAMLDCNADELTEETGRTYKTRKGVPLGRAILEYIKVGRQRAATGARLRVIRQITGMPCSFNKADIGRPMKFVRIAQDTSYILQTPEGRAMATAQALGFDAAALFGAKKPALESGACAFPRKGQGSAEHPGGMERRLLWFSPINASRCAAFRHIGCRAAACLYKSGQSG